MHYTLLAQYYYTCCEVQCLMFDLLLEYFHEITKITITGYLHHCTGKVKLQFPMHLNWLCIPYLGKILQEQGYWSLCSFLACMKFFIIRSTIHFSMQALSFLVNRVFYIHSSIISAAAEATVITLHFFIAVQIFKGSTSLTSEICVSMLGLKYQASGSDL